MFSAEILARFEKLTKRGDGCWQWQGKPDKDGYGCLRIGGRKVCKAHRAAWMIANNIDPGEKLICHHCDNPGCVNPAHLYRGTIAENNKDRAKRNRSNPTKGSDQWKAKLTDGLVASILSEYQPGITSQEELGKKFGVTQACICLILHGKHWKHVPRPHEIVVGRKSGSKRMFTDEMEMEIVKEYLAGGASQQSLGFKYGVSQAKISLIVIKNKKSFVSPAGDLVA